MPILLRIILQTSLITFAWITGIIILCHQRKVLIGLTILSNGIKTTPASRTSNQCSQFLFSASFYRWGQNNKSVGSEIPIQIMKLNEFIFEILTSFINKSFETDCFPDRLKEENITPFFKKDDPVHKSSYKPVSILPFISKVYKRLIYNQLSEYAERFLSHIWCVFRKVHSTQHRNRIQKLEPDDGYFHRGEYENFNKIYWNGHTVWL